MREKMQHRFVSPLTLVKIIGILRKSGKVYNAKVAASSREIKGSGFANIIETRPNKLSRAEGCVFHHIPSSLVSGTPRSARVIVRRAKKRCIDKRAALTWQSSYRVAGHGIEASRLQSRYTFAQQEGFAGEILGYFSHLLTMIVKANNVYRPTFKQMVVGRSFVTSRRNESRGVVTAYNIGKPSRNFRIVAKFFIICQSRGVAGVIK